MVADQSQILIALAEKGSKKKKTGFTYCPSLGTIPSETNENSWFYEGVICEPGIKEERPNREIWGWYIYWRWK